MKKSRIGWFIGVGLVVILLAIGKLIYTSTPNDGEKYAQQYINESVYVTLHIPDNRKDITYRTGGKKIGDRKKTTERISTDSIIFYDNSYKKHFCVIVVEIKEPDFFSQSVTVNDDIRHRTSIKARINKYELYSPRYGSKTNPIPVLDFDYNLREPRDQYDEEEYESLFSRPAYYKRAVELYLTYMMSKEEFKERFEKE